MERGTILRTANNRYEIGECLGRGAQGSVYQARRQDGFTVAIKLVRQYTADALRRLQTEGWAYQRFDSRFVKLFDWKLDCARPFLVMEFCKYGSARIRITYLSTWHSVTIPLGSSRGRVGRATQMDCFIKTSSRRIFYLRKRVLVLGWQNLATRDCFAHQTGSAFRK